MIKIFFLDRNNWTNILLISSFISFGLFPILPNNLKGLPVVVLLGSSIFISIRHKRFSSISKKELFSFLLFSSLYLVYFISIFYTENLKTGFRRLETCAALLVIPLCFLLIGKQIVNRDLLKQFGKYFFWSSTLFSLSIIYYFLYLGYYSGVMNLGESMSWMDHEMPLIKQHAIYASMFISIGLIMSKYILKSKTLLVRLIAIMAIVINTYVLFLLLRKGVIIALLLALIVSVIRNFKKARLKLILPLLIVIVCISYVFKDSIYDRSKEVFTLDTYAGLNTDNSTSMRFVIYKCVIDEIYESPVMGHGVGDGYDLIARCLNEQYGVVFKDSKQKKNSHNQYLGILLYTGFVGLIIFFAQLFVYFKTSFKTSDSLMLQFLIFFSVLFLIENVLDRQSGVIMFAFIINALYSLNTNQPKTSLE